MNKSKVPLNAELQMDEKILRSAIFHAVKMWGDPNYERFLHRKKPGQLDEDEKMFDWFKWFVGDWRVERNIKKGKRNFVRRYLDKNFRKRLASGDEASAVDEAAQIIKEKGWGAKESKNGNGPRSLVSKIGFFLKPNTLIPIDRFARDGLNKWRKNRRVSSSRFESYCEYLGAFNEEFGHVEPQIRSGLAEHWVKLLAKRFRCRVRDLKSPSLRRKVFDNYLMDIGRAKARPAASQKL